jgi:succinyl-diaminopimelate desuccinylase
MTPVLKALLDHLDTQRDAVIELQRELVAIPALGPENSEDSTNAEEPKAAFLDGYIRRLGLPDPEWINAPDERVVCGFRPNLLCRLPGEDTSRTLWVIGHTDVVPPGDPSLWASDPWTLRVEGDRMYGRGTEDNHQAIVSGLLLANAFQRLDIAPPCNLGLLLVADEETGSGFGLDYVLKQRPELFTSKDLFVVPDFGRPDSTMIEVAEKSMLWVKVAITGKQCHASTPYQGRNTLRATARLIVLLDSLYQDFDARDDLFDPPHSTFEPTKKEANVPNVNTVPGYDVFYMDCRVLPEYDLEQVLDRIRELGRQVEDETGVRIEYQAAQYAQAAPPTPQDSEVVRRLATGIRHVYGVEAQPMGIGGGTVAAFLRRQGHHAAVWATCVHNAHQPNEFSLISTQIGDAKVMAHALYQPCP